MSRRRTLGTLGAAAVAAGAVLAAPTLGTQANWYESKDTNVPAMRMGAINLAVTDKPVGAPWPATLQSTLTNNSAFGLEYAPTTLTFRPWPGSPTTVPNDSTGFTSWGRGVAYDYTDCGSTTLWQVPLTDTAALPATYSPTAGRRPLTRGSSAALCLTIQPDMTDHDRYTNFAGREYQLTTTLQAVAAASTWTASASWTTRYVVPIPAPMLGSNGQVCGTSLLDNVGIFWAWPDAGTSSTLPTDYSAITNWIVLARPRGSTRAYTPVVSVVPGTDRDQTVSYGEMSAAGLGAAGDYEFVVRGYPVQSNLTRYSESTVVWYAHSNAGSSGWWQCQGTAANPDAGMHGY